MTSRDFRLLTDCPERILSSGTAWKVQFLWSRSHCPVLSSLSLNISREVCLYLGDQRLVPCVLDTKLKVFNIETRTRVDVTLEKKLTTAAVPCLLEGGVVLYVGYFSPYKKDACTVNLHTFEVTDIADMLVERGWPGVIRIQSIVYVFGGNNPMISTCEKLDTCSMKWSLIPSMQHPRYSFTPVLYNDEVYLADMMQQVREMEAFNPVSETYRIVPVRFPHSSRHSLAFNADGEMYILTLDFMIGRWRFESNEAEFQESRIRTHNNEDRPYCGSPPLIFERKVYFPHYTMGVLCEFDLDSDSLSRFGSD